MAQGGQLVGCTALTNCHSCCRYIEPTNPTHFITPPCMSLSLSLSLSLPHQSWVTPNVKSFMLSNKANIAPNITNTPGLHIFHAHNRSSHSLSLPAYTPFPSFLIPLVNETMRDRRMDRFVILPFSSACISQSSIAVCEDQPRRAPGGTVPSTPSQEGATRFLGKQQLKNSFSISLEKKNSFSIAAGFQKLIKSLAQHFVEEDEEVEMEIGFPTDVQHVAHIGLDGFDRRSWDKAAAPELLSLPSLSLRQFELAMAAAPPLPHGPPGSWPQ